MSKKHDPRGNDSADTSLVTHVIERILSNYVAERGGVRPPFAHTIKWLWIPGTGPVAHVKVERAPDNVRPTPSRFVRIPKKGPPP